MAVLRAVSFRMVARPQPDAEPADTGTVAVWFWCPGCQEAHMVQVGGIHEGPKWEWNGSLELPTFAPSILVRYGDQPGDKRCHSFVRDGRIQFLQDCSHALAGQTVDLPKPPA